MAKVQPAIISCGFSEHASKRSDVNMAELVNEAVENSIEMANIDWKDIDLIINGNMPAFEGANMPELWMGDHMASKNKPMLRVTTGGTTGGSVTIAGYYAIASGLYDTVLAIYEFQTKDGIIRAFYQTITTNSNQGYFETFMGDQGTLYISESAGRAGIYREQTAPDWSRWVDMGYLIAPKEEEKSVESQVLDVRETIAPPKHELPVVFNDPYHKPHLENFFNTIRGNDMLNCPAEIGYETAVTVLKVNQAVRTGRKLWFKKNEFKV